MSSPTSAGALVMPQHDLDLVDRPQMLQEIDVAPEEATDSAHVAQSVAHNADATQSMTFENQVVYGNDSSARTEDMARLSSPNSALHGHLILFLM